MGSMAVTRLARRPRFAWLRRLFDQVMGRLIADVANIRPQSAVPAPDDLTALLAAIDAEEQAALGSMEDGINLTYAYRRAAILKTMPKHLVVAALKALEEERRATLATIRRRVQAEMRTRQRFAIAARAKSQS